MRSLTVGRELRGITQVLESIIALGGARNVLKATFEAGNYLPAQSAEPGKRARARKTNRRIRAHILSDTCGVPHLTVELVLVDTVRGCGFTDMASTTGVHELVGGAVFLGVKKIGALAAETKVDLIGLLRAVGGRGRGTGRHC